MLAFVHVALWETAIIDRILIIRICPILCTFHLHIILFPKPGAIDATCRISAAAAAARPLLSDSRLTCNMFPSATVCPSGTQSCDFSCDSFASNQKVNFSQGFCRAASRMCVCVCLCILLLASCTHRENNHKTPPPSPPSPLQQKQQSICAFVLVFACSAISVCASFILFVCAIIFRHSLGFLLLLLLLMGYWTIDSTEFIVRPGTGDHFSVRDFCSDKCWKVHCADIIALIHTFGKLPALVARSVLLVLPVLGSLNCLLHCTQSVCLKHFHTFFILNCQQLSQQLHGR